MAAWYLPLGTALRSSKSLKPNNLAKLRITPNRSIQFGEMLRRGKMDRRRQPLLQSAPDLLYKEALSEPYNSAKSPGKPLVTGAFCPDGVKNVPTKIVSNPRRDGAATGGHSHLAGVFGLLPAADHQGAENAPAHRQRRRGQEPHRSCHALSCWATV